MAKLDASQRNYALNCIDTYLREFEERLWREHDKRKAELRAAAAKALDGKMVKVRRAPHYGGFYGGYYGFGITFPAVNKAMAKTKKAVTSSREATEKRIGDATARANKVKHEIMLSGNDGLAKLLSDFKESLK